ncbi:uncharacterized protein cubi_01683 [Cryptosporidium ubiquitum]|uniref:RING-type domain-containing protein n=1 Tax=Cryptosporidium ubiquitum TaxID=857276 RepID=A0A1J4MIQ7_9CRYT|nr:uncharacterized protein cubi_01683 [Cryptosporidium ubiquitum]OII72733.1 hypothetical protein cubi_01683 [Cryptosporidium ubiquitum]
MNENDNILLDDEYINRISKNSIKKVLKKNHINHSSLNNGFIGFINNSNNCNTSISCSANSTSNSSSSNANIIGEGEGRGRYRSNSSSTIIIDGNNYLGIHSGELCHSKDFYETGNEKSNVKILSNNSYALTDLRENSDEKNDNCGNKKTRKKDGNEQINLEEVKKLKIPDCSICREYLTRNLTVITVCGHVFHKQCIDAWLSKCDSNKNLNMAQGRLNYLLNDNGEPTCPLCRVPCSLFTLCDLVNITIDETLILDDSEDKFQCFQKEEVVSPKNTGECIQINCRLKLKSATDESEAKSKEIEELRTQLNEEKTKALVKTDLNESLERKNEVLREDLNRITHELGEMNQKYSDLHRKYTFIQSNNAINNFMGEKLQDDLTDPNIQVDETNQISNLIGFNPFEGEDSLEKREDTFQALKVLSNAFIKLSSRYDQLKEKSSKWKAKCYQLKDSHTTSINECNFLKEKLRNLNKIINTSEIVKEPSTIVSNVSNVENSAKTPSNMENDEESFSYISKLIQDKKTTKNFIESNSRSQTNQENKIFSNSSQISYLKSNKILKSSSSIKKNEFGGINTEGKSEINTIKSKTHESERLTSRNEESPNPNYSTLIKSRRNHVIKRNIPIDSQSISSFFYTRKPKLKLID